VSENNYLLDEEQKIEQNKESLDEHQEINEEAKQDLLQIANSI